MNSIAFIFSTGPHGTSIGREGLDVILSATSYIHNIAVFFINDGVFQLIQKQNPEKIFSRNYILSFGILLFYKKNQYYICSDSIEKRGLKTNLDWILPVQILKSKKIREKLNSFELIINL